MSIAIIVNPTAGGTRSNRGRAAIALGSNVVDRDGTPAEWFLTTRPGHARDLAKAAVARGVRLVIAWGGDGTINEVASATAFTAVPLGIVPAGSGNGLARELGIDMRPDRAIADAIRAEPRAMDVGEIGGRLFVNLAGIGFDAYVAGQFNAPGNRRRGLTGYASVAARALFRYRAAQYAITTPEGRIDRRAVLVTIANSAQFGNGACIAPGACVDDGELDLVVVEDRSRIVTLGHVRRLFNGTANQMPGYTIQRIRQVTIACDQPMLFHVDGEPVEGGTELTARVHPAALRICVK